MIRKKGFTLIELLVVISIISLLSSIILSSLSSARMKARDTRRIQDLIQIRNALELYYSDNGIYPKSKNLGCTIDGHWCVSTIDSDWDLLATALTSKYISKIPKDPINKNVGTGSSANRPWSDINNLAYAYTSGHGGCSDGSCYDLVANLEDQSSPYRNQIKNYRWFTNQNPLNSHWYDNYGDINTVKQLYSPQN